MINTARETAPAPMMTTVILILITITIPRGIHPQIKDDRIGHLPPTIVDLRFRVGLGLNVETQFVRIGTTIHPIHKMIEEQLFLVDLE